MELNHLKKGLRSTQAPNPNRSYQIRQTAPALGNSPRNLNSKLAQNNPNNNPNQSFSRQLPGFSKNVDVSRMSYDQFNSHNLSANMGNLGGFGGGAVSGNTGSHNMRNTQNTQTRGNNFQKNQMPRGQYDNYQSNNQNSVAQGYNSGRGQAPAQQQRSGHNENIKNSFNPVDRNSYGNARGKTGVHGQTGQYSGRQHGDNRSQQFGMGNPRPQQAQGGILIDL